MRLPLGCFCGVLLLGMLAPAVVIAPRPASASEPVNACGCYRDDKGACKCSRQSKCGCPEECEPVGCEAKREREADKAAAAAMKQIAARERKKAAEANQKAKVAAQAAKAAARDDQRTRAARAAERAADKRTRALIDDGEQPRGKKTDAKLEPKVGDNDKGTAGDVLPP